MIRLEDIPELTAQEVKDLMVEFEGLAEIDTVSYIEVLLSNSTLDHDQRAEIERTLHDMDIKTSYDVIQYLKINQQSPNEGNLGSQKQTARFIRSFCKTH